MRVPGHQRESYTWRRTAALAGLAVLVIALVMALVVRPAERVRAASVITLASATISADTFASGAYTSLIGPVVQEGAVGDATIGSIVLSAPSGFEFRTTGTVTVSVSPSGTGGTKIDTDTGCGSYDDSEPAVLTTGTITITVCVASTTASTITWSGIGVRPTSGTPTSGTITGAGITGVTDFGVLNEVNGSPATITLTAPGTVSGAVLAILGPWTAHVVDQFANPAIGAPVNWSITSAPSTATCQQLIAPQVTTDGSGDATTYLKLGNVAGSYQVAVASGTIGPYTFPVATATGDTNAPCATPTSTPTPTGSTTPTPTVTPTPTATGSPTPTPTPTAGAMESVTLAGGVCNPVASTYPDATPIATIAGAVAPSSILASIWWFDAFTLTWHGYSAQAPQASNLTQVDRLDAFSICVSSAGAWSRPKI